MEPVIFLALALFLIALREGMVLSNWQTGKQKYLQTWHRAGWAIRFCLISAVAMLTKHTGFMWYFVAGSVVVAWPVYNIIINLFTGKKWYYLSNKGIDGIIRKCLPFIKFDK